MSKNKPYGETAYTRDMVKFWRALKHEVFNITASAAQGPSWPDVHLTSPIYTGYIEFKGLETKVEPHQIEKILSLNEKSPGSALIIRQRCPTWKALGGTGVGSVQYIHPDTKKSMQLKSASIFTNPIQAIEHLQFVSNALFMSYKKRQAES